LGRRGRRIARWEFIELYDAGNLPVHLPGWTLDGIEGVGSKPYSLQDTVLPAYGFLTFFRSRTNAALTDTGDTVRLLGPDGGIVDQISYRWVRASNLL
jgi:Lamin Tail Domain